MPRSRNLILFGLLWAVTFGLGMWGFLLASPALSISTAALAALQLFALNSGVVEGPVPWPLEAARWLAVVFSGSALIGIVRGVAADAVLRARLYVERTLPGRRLLAPRCVVMGLGRKGISLVNDLRAWPDNPYRVLGIDRDPERVAVARGMGIDTIQADATTDEALQRLPWHRTAWVALLMGGEEANITATLGITRLRGDASTRVAVHVANLQLRNLLARQDALKARGVRLFNHYERLARRALLAYPVEACDLPPVAVAGHSDLLLGLQGVSTAQEQVPHVFIRPCRDFTPALVAMLARSAHFPRTARRPWTRIRVVLVGNDAESELAAIRVLHPALRRIGDHALLDLEALVPEQGQSPAEALGARVEALPAGTPVSVYLDLHNPSLALIESLALLDRLGVTIATATATPSLDLRCIFDYAEEPAITRFVEAHPGLQRHVRPLPSMADCCGGTVLFDREDRMDRLAQHIHGQYDSTGTQPWEGLSLELQDSNRAAADHVGVVLRHLRDVGVDMEGPGFDWDATLLETLAECEHRRWSAQKLMAGWEAEATLGEGQDRLRKRHGCLDRPYAALSDAMRERDRAHVRSIPALLGVALGETDAGG